MMFEFDGRQREAIDAPFDTSVAIVGGAGSGKSSTLEGRAAHGRRLYPASQPLIERAPYALADLAWSILAGEGIRAHEVDDIEAELMFAYSAAPLLAMAWPELLERQLDPEVPGLRSPTRFLESAFRLIRKLRDAAMSPNEFQARSLAGATAFYAKPPNFAHPELIGATKDAYRDSLDVTSAELARQHRREIDLAKILAKLYARYLDLSLLQNCLTKRDAIAIAIERIDARPELATEVRTRTGFACIDDAQELSAGEMALLQRIFGLELTAVTLAGDPGSAIGGIRGIRADAVFAAARQRIELREQYRSPAGIEFACRQLESSMEKIVREPVEAVVTLHRAKSSELEGLFIAERIAELLARGAAAHTIAILFRSVADVQQYEGALLARGVAVQCGGDYNIFTDRRALDALALLWNLWDPFRHDWLLRTLSNPALALSDASIATLCSEPSDPQTALFLTDDEEAIPAARASRWDPKRDVRLGWNFIRGDRDGDLNDGARARIQRFRTMRRKWLAHLETQPLDAVIEGVWNDALARRGAPGSALAITQELALKRLFTRLTDVARASPAATLGDVLAYAQGRAESGLEACEIANDDRFVRMLSIEAAAGLEFDHVVVADVRAGSLPRWYVPDAFLFSPNLGMIPKENVGDARAARTAKFSYYLHRTKIREQYNAQERRAFIYALRRARYSAIVTASGRPTRGLTAPEFLEELQASNLPGTTVI